MCGEIVNVESVVREGRGYFFAEGREENRVVKNVSE